MGAMPDTMQPAPLPSAYQLRVVVRGVSPLIWRRLLVPADTTIADLHAVLQTAFGWTGTHLHRFVVHGREDGTGYVGGPSFGDDPRRVRLGDLGLRPTERFTYHYDFTAGWCLDLRVEQGRAGCARPAPAGLYRWPPCRSAGGLRRGAGLPRRHPGPSRAGRGRPGGRDPGQAPGRRGHPTVRRAPRRTRRPAPAARRGAFRPADAEPCPGSPGRDRDQGGMKITVQVVLHADDESETVVREAFTVQRKALTPDTVGLQLQEAKDLLAAVQDTLVEHQVTTALSAQAACPDCGTPQRHRTAGAS